MTKTIRKETTKEFDEQGRCVREITTEETIEDNSITYQPYNYPWLGSTSVNYCDHSGKVATATNDDTTAAYNSNTLE